MDVISYALSRKYHDSPIASYTLTSNKEVVISAVDVDTDTFTSIGHGLLNTNLIAFTPNAITTSEYLGRYFPGGVSSKTYYVVNKTSDTFQISTTNGGEAVNLTTNANMDLSKIHVERVTNTINISGLPSLKKCRVFVLGKHMTSSNYVYPNGVTQAPNWSVGTTPTYGYGNTTVAGNIYVQCEIVLDYNAYLSMDIRAFGLSADTDTANKAKFADTIQVCPAYYGGVITSLTFTNWDFFNGTKIEVYKA